MLSHCWGDKIPMRTTEETVAQHQHEMPLETMPKTFADAVVVTRRLHLRYLWIDSLCIIQDEPDDWAEQSSQMADIYKHATVCLSATSAKDSTEGMLVTLRSGGAATCELSLLGCPDTDGRPIPILLKFPISEDYNNYVKARGWILQEPRLAPRTIQFQFNHDRTYRNTVLTCSRLKSPGEIYVTNDVEDITYFEGYDNIHASKDRFNHDPHTSRRLCWYQVVGDFTSRTLCYLTDTFPALSGIASELWRDGKAGPAPPYVAGLWAGRDMIHDLLWHRTASGGSRTTSPHDPGTFIAPSWSWASANAPVQFVHCRFQWESFNNSSNPRLSCPHAFAARVTKYHVHPENANNPLGGIKSGAYIEIRGPLMPIAAFKINDGPLPSDVFLQRGHEQKKSTEGDFVHYGTVRFDGAEPPLNARVDDNSHNSACDASLWCLLLEARRLRRRTGSRSPRPSARSCGCGC